MTEQVAVAIPKEDHAVEIQAEPDLCVPNEIIKDRWEVIGKIGAGCFGQCYTVRDKVQNRIEALKVEAATKGDRAQLPVEVHVLKKFQGKKHATELIGAGTDGKINYIVMELVGENLAHLRRRAPTNPKHFSLGTTIRLSKQVLEAIQELHSVFVVHRDIKPSNFAMGRVNTETKNTVFMLDFGLAKFYADDQGNIREERENVGFRGTLRYCSLTAHYKKDLGRKDDLISQLYMTTELLIGVLPWTGGKTIRDVTVSKEKNRLEQLMPDLIQMRKYSEHLNSLHFASQPDYDLLIQLFDDIMTQYKIYSTDVWDWENDYKVAIEEDESTRSKSDEGQKSKEQPEKLMKTGQESKEHPEKLLKTVDN